MVKHDIHVHTHLSNCGDRLAFMKDYIVSAKEMGLETVGFADHCWDRNIKGASDWYIPQPYERLEARKRELEEIDTQGINVLLGAEGEYAKEVLAVSESALDFVDYIVIPHSHTHMKGLVLPTDCENSPEKHGNYLVKSFISLCNHQKRNLFFGIVHPMYPIGKSLEEAEIIYSFITDEMLSECAAAAKEAGVVLELNLTVCKNVMNAAKGKTCYRRFFEICKNAGCEFFLGSDAHSIQAFKARHGEKEEIIKFFGFTEEDLTVAKLRKQNG